MSQKKSRKERKKQNEIRSIVRQEIQNFYDSKVENEIYDISRGVARRVMREYDSEEKKPSIVEAKHVMDLFDFNWLSDSKPRNEEYLRSQAQEIYDSLGVPFGTPLYYGEGMKLKVYPQHLLPKSYTTKKIESTQTASLTAQELPSVA